ncbi:Multidrug efflux pump subunit AcrB [Natronincola peptidivorans]|uniref:Multidrug efflux pump subunit AcrB n=1 Tax=Natronincola peptidivorans TaxID=426128 RepID=A0A1I0C8T4_9FIRM|nr:efflux RND transporter permease subunit [Natronincola peptidivorans]SET15649.1 Multidrug efflux pump subunit AcrB [Natronincola peptidivorans]
MFKNIIKLPIKNKTVTIFLMIMIIIFGFYSYHTIPKQEYPDFPVPAAIITVIYPGASAEEIEVLVTEKLEEKLAELRNYDYTQSTSLNSVASIILALDSNISQAELDQTWNELYRTMEDEKNHLPAGVSDISIDTDFYETSGILISLSGDNYSYEQLVAYGERLKNNLIGLGGINRFVIIGEQEKEVKVEVNLQKLDLYNLSLRQITSMLTAQNIQLPSGSIQDDTMKYSVNQEGLFKSLEEIESTVLYIREDNIIVRLKDVAEVYMGLKDSNYKIRNNGENGILLVGFFKEDVNIVTAGKDVREVIDKFKGELPEDISINEIVYQPDEVGKSVNNFIKNLIGGIFIVILVVMLGMGIRNATTVSFAIPLSMFIAFITMGILGIKVHFITITGLIMALGMLVDNAIVVSDSIQNKIDGDIDQLTACVEGTKEVAIPVLSSTLTTIAAFSPLLFLPVTTGAFFGGIPQMIIISLIASYGIAIFITPLMAYLFFRKSKCNRKKDSKIKGIFERLLFLGMKYKVRTLLVSFIILILSLTLVSTLPQELFPKSDKDMIYIDIQTEYLSNLNKTDDLVKEIEAVLREQPEITTYTSSIGGGLPKFDISTSPQSNAPNSAQIVMGVNLSKGGVFKTNEELVRHLQGIYDERIVGADVIVKELEIEGFLGAPIQIRIKGNAIEEIIEAKEKIKEALIDIEGGTNVRDDLPLLDYQFSMKIDGNRALAYGLTKYDIQNEVNKALMGRGASVFRKEGKEYDILVKGNISRLEELENMKIKSSAKGEQVLLKDVADISFGPVIGQINRYEGQRTIAVQGDVVEGYNAIEVQTILEEKIKDMDLSNVIIVPEGEKADLEGDLGNMGISATFALFLLFIILMIQFNSVIQPGIILAPIPLSLIGSIVALVVLRQPLSLFSVLGMVSLMGVVINNAIILIDYINSQRKTGMPIEEACRKAVSTRFRPVILSTTTTVFGLFPLAFFGNDLFRPMAVAFMGGLMIATLLTLVIIPVLYSLIEGKIEAFKRKDNKKLDLNI